MTIAELTEKILKEGYRITRENLDKELLLTADLEEMLDCAGKLQKHFCGNLVDSAPSSTGGADAAVKTANTAPRPPATIPALTNTAFCRKTRFLRLQKQTRTRV